MTGGSFGMDGSDGSDFINGGFWHDPLNGGTGANCFYDLGIFDHGFDWIQDHAAVEYDRLVFGTASDTRSQFQVNLTETTGAGRAGVAGAFVIYRPTGQILWAPVDGGTQKKRHPADRRAEVQSAGAARVAQR